VSHAAEWLATREPPPPGLAARLRREGHGGSLSEVFTSAACALLAEARARPGRVRESAFRLLEADALVTYACEAALDAEDPESAILDVLAATAR
jgi:hypothetical protein